MCFLGWRRRKRSNDAPEALEICVCVCVCIYTYLYTGEMRGEPKPIAPLSNTLEQQNVGGE